MMAASIPSDKEQRARRDCLIRAFNLLNGSTPDQKFTRIELFGEDSTHARKLWALGVIKVLRAQGFIGRTGGSAPLLARYFRHRLIPTDERIFQMCLFPKAMLTLIKSGAAPTGPPVEAPAPKLTVVAQPAAAASPASPVLESEPEPLADAADSDVAVDTGTPIALLRVPDDFDPSRALLEAVIGIRQVKSRMTVIEHRLMELQDSVATLLREWTGAKP